MSEYTFLENRKNQVFAVSENVLYDFNNLTLYFLFGRPRNFETCTVFVLEPNKKSDFAGPCNVIISAEYYFRKCNIILSKIRSNGSKINVSTSLSPCKQIGFRHSKLRCSHDKFKSFNECDRDRILRLRKSTLYYLSFVHLKYVSTRSAKC